MNEREVKQMSMTLIFNESGPKTDLKTSGPDAEMG